MSPRVLWAWSVPACRWRTAPARRRRCHNPLPGAARPPARTRPDDPVVEEGVVAEGRGAEVRDASTFGHGHVPGERVSDEGVVSSPGLLARLRLRPRRLAYGHRPAIELGLESSTAELGGRVICE